MNASIKHITADNFTAEVLQSARPVLVDYWADWCGPCKMIGPVLDQAAQDYAGRLEVAKVDVDAQQALAARYQVRGIPTLMLFKAGEVVATKVGAVSAVQLGAFIDAHL